MKAVLRTPELDERWGRLPATHERNKSLHTSPLLLSPRFHILTETEWIRAYPSWPTDLSHYLQSSGSTFPAADALQVLIAINEGLVLLESEGILHRDLKSSNILVRALGVDPFRFELALADFSDETTCGTEFWSAPELCANRPTIYSPIFSLGVMAWKLLARDSFKKMVTAFPLYRKGDTWPTCARWLLTDTTGCLEDHLSRALADRWRDASPSEVRTRLLDFIGACCVYEEPARRARFSSLVGVTSTQAPLRSALEWLCRLAASPAGSTVTTTSVPTRARAVSPQFLHREVMQ